MQRIGSRHSRDIWHLAQYIKGDADADVDIGAKCERPLTIRLAVH